MLVDNIEGIARKDDPELEVVEPKRPFEINSGLTFKILFRVLKNILSSPSLYFVLWKTFYNRRGKG